MSEPAAQKGSLRAWILASRPATLTVAVVPILVGAAVAHGQGPLRVGPLLAALFSALWIQIGTNLANDVFDYEKGADTHQRLGPLRVTQAGLLTPRQVRRGMLLSFGLATLGGVYLAWACGWVIVGIGVASIASGLAYTGGPYPLGYHGLGDVFVFVFFGLVAVCGTVFVAAGRVETLAGLSAVPVGALATAILVVNNVRDAATDRVVGKRTLVARFGRSFGVVEYHVLLGLAYATPLLLLWRGQGSVWLLLPLLTLPLCVPLCRTMIGPSEGPAMNQALAGTARLLLLYGVCFAIGLLAS